MTPGFMISAPSSGTGKTTLTLALARAFSLRGLAVQCFKSGPDYIDPGFHKAASGRSSFNLDSWAMDTEMLHALAAAGNGSDIVIAEGSMGLYDGVSKSGATGTGASADISSLMGWPVILVIDPAGQAQTAAAVAKGLSEFRADVRVAGVILNRIASPRHEALVRQALAEVNIPLFGALPRNSPLTMPERHLGLVLAEEQTGLLGVIDAAAKLVERHIDLDAIVSAAASCANNSSSAIDRVTITPPGQRIALAKDAAFAFVYSHLAEGWRNSGAEILPFSPLNDDGPDPSADVCWLSGGYPELYAGQLSAAVNFKKGVTSFAQTRPVHGECGGYMAMGESLIDADGTAHRMLGLLGLDTSYAARKLHLGYRHARLLSPLPGYATGSELRGHEFHYASILKQADEPLAVVCDAYGATVAETGSRRGLATGSFFHLMAGNK